MANHNANPSRSSMKSQLAGAKRTMHKIQNPYENVITEGVDHLNVFSGTSDLGRWLNFNSSATSFTHPVLGEFRTLQGFRAHISSRHPLDTFRRAYGHRLSQAIKAHQKPIRIDNQLAIIMDAAFIRMLADEKRAAEFADCKLPFVAYYTNDDIRYAPREAHDLILGYKIIQKALRTKTQPDFTPIMTHPNKDLYEDITPLYLKKQAEALAETQEEVVSEKSEAVPCALLSSTEAATVVPEKSEAVPCALLSSTETATNVCRDENSGLCVEVESVEQPVESIPAEAVEVSQEEVDTSEIASLMQKAVAADGSEPVTPAVALSTWTNVELTPQPPIESVNMTGVVSFG